MNKPFDDRTDYPAAHSMDAQWFAIDDAGEVAWLDTGESGAMPIDGLKTQGFFDMLDRLAKDEHGIPLLPTSGEQFAQGHSTEPLFLMLARLIERERRALAVLTGNESLGPEDPLVLEKIRNRTLGHAVVLLADSADATAINYTTIRLDSAKPLYYVVAFPMMDALRLHSLGRVLAFRQIDGGEKGNFMFTMGLPEVLGVYCFSTKIADLEERTDADGQTVRLPPRYERNVIPANPRIGMPPTTNPDGRSFVHALPGVRFAELRDFQLVDHIACDSWSGHYPAPKKDE